MLRNAEVGPTVQQAMNSLRLAMFMLALFSHRRRLRASAGEAAPSFALPDAEGRIVELGKLRGGSSMSTSGHRGAARASARFPG